MPGSSILIPRICEYCDKPFLARNVNTRFCSAACNNKSLRARRKREKEEQRQIVFWIQKKKKLLIFKLGLIFLYRKLLS
ncbi:hypothetical protein HMPREF1080_01157 [Bacteroides fragilis CL05T12C13]|uniref:Uncharacterized protein n=1 Tax=Bacteroides fragilis CL05T12C13 TaxID=997881 RepID=I9KLG8_BACFG|nr:hypothetical protein HMPREF1080_01157 [Bacteroides fragilis CL05T12C13]